MALCVLSSVAALVAVLVIAGPADDAKSAATVCESDYSYAGVQGRQIASGVSAALTPVETPTVTDGHVGGWIGVGGADAGPGGAAEWLQVGLATFEQDRTSRLYYEVKVTGKEAKYVQLDSSVAPNETHRLAVVEVAGRTSWWRVRVDGRPASPAIHLPGSHGTWFPQALGESWNDGSGSCNAYSYRFSKVMLDAVNGGGWKPLERSSSVQDTGYKVVQTSSVPRSFVAASRS